MSTHEPQAGFPCAYGKYQLLARIGTGGMAEIFRARLPGVEGFEKILVIKRLLPHLTHQRQMVQMFVNEAKIAAKVQHRNIVQIFELGQLPETGEFFIAMEHVEGTDLRKLLRAAAVNAMRLPPWFSVHVVAEVLNGLIFAHALRTDDGTNRNIVHRDVTPANIFVSALGDIKLGDFGVAKDDAAQERTKAGQFKGKVPYMSPEQLYGRDIDARTDVFAAGVVLWECLTQRRLFGGRPDIESMNLIISGERVPPSRFVGDIPPELDEVVMRALHTDKEQRTSSAAEMHGQLLDVLPLLRDRVHQSNVRSIVESMLGNKDPSANTGPGVVVDDSIVKKNFLDTHSDSHPKPQIPPPAGTNPTGTGAAPVAKMAPVRAPSFTHSQRFTNPEVTSLVPERVPERVPSRPAVDPLADLNILDVAEPPHAPKRAISQTYSIAPHAQTVIPERSLSAPNLHGDPPATPPRSISAPSVHVQVPHQREQVDASVLFKSQDLPQRPSQSLAAQPIPAPTAAAPTPIIHQPSASTSFASRAPEASVSKRSPMMMFDAEDLSLPSRSMSEAVRRSIESTLPEPTTAPVLTPPKAHERIMATPEDNPLAAIALGQLYDGIQVNPFYAEEHPFFVRGQDGTTVGPVSATDALEVLRFQSRSNAIHQTSIRAGDRTEWMGAIEFAMLTGQEILLDTDADQTKQLPKSLITGSFAKTSPTALFGHLAKEEVNGRLIICNAQTGQTSRREILLVGGRPTFVYANAQELQLPEQFLSKKLCGREQLDETLFEVVQKKKPLETLLSKRSGVDTVAYYGAFMKDRLMEIFKWREARYAVDSHATVTHTKPFVSSLMNLLLEAVLRTKSEYDLESAIEPWLDMKLVRSERFNRAVAEMRLNEQQIQALIPFGGRTLRESLKLAGRDGRLRYALAYILIQTDLLLRPLKGS